MKNEVWCPISYKCGGCDYASIPYCEELDDKFRYVYSLFSRYCTVYDVMGMENPGYYRNKVQSVLGEDRSGKIVSGLYRKGTHDIVSVRSCRLEFPESAKIMSSVRSLMRSYRLRPYDEDRFSGDIRHVLMRKSLSTGDVMVVLVFGTSSFRLAKDFANSLMNMHPEIRTVARQVNGGKTSMVLSDAPVEILRGPGFITDRIFDLEFKISPSSFFQVNVRQTEALYSMAIRMAELSGRERVLDAYCGTGTIALVAGRKASSVVGVELNTKALEDARENAVMNGLGNVTFVNADASVFCKQMAKDKERFDVAFLDPPRSGSDERFLSSLIKLGPKRIVYISCNPETQERDCRYLEGFGPYRLVAIQPVDMFPRTMHIETVALLTQTKSRIIS